MSFAELIAKCRCAARYKYSIACIVAPILFFLGLFQGLVRPPTTSILSNLVFTPVNSVRCLDKMLRGEDADLSGPDRLGAAGLGGYYDFAITSTFLIVVCGITIVLSVWCIWRRWQNEIRIRLLMLALLAFLGGLAAWKTQSTHGMREILILPIFKSHPFGTFFPSPSPQVEATFAILARVKAIISFNVALVPVAGMAVLLALAGLSGPTGTNAPTEQVLRQRLFAVRGLLGLVSVALTLTVVASHASGTWVLRLLCKSNADALMPIVNAVSNYWGAGTSGVILCGFTPALVNWWEDRRKAEVAADFLTEKDRREWLDREGLAFAPQSGFFSLLAAGLPALAAPLSNALQFLA